MASLSELREKKRLMEEERKKLDKEIANAEAEELVNARAIVAKKIADMSDEEKRWLIDHTEHSRSSCSDDNIANGFWTACYKDKGSWRCPKCMMMEILNGEHGGRFDFKLTIEIFEVKV